MKAPRIGIGWIMALVAIVAIDFGVFRACYDGPWARSRILANQIDFLVRGSLPMANILAFGLLLGLRRRASHPSLLGFEVFGVLALVIYSSLMFVLCQRYNIRHIAVVPRIFRSNHVLGQCVASALLVLPQLALAMVGGFLSRKFVQRAGTAGRVGQLSALALSSALGGSFC